jgi:hypothetical protein
MVAIPVALAGRQAQATASSSTVAAAATASPKVLADAVFYTKTAALKIGPIGPQHITAGRAGIRVKYVNLTAHGLRQPPLGTACYM